MTRAKVTHVIDDLHYDSNCEQKMSLCGIHDADNLVSMDSAIPHVRQEDERGAVDSHFCKRCRKSVKIRMRWSRYRDKTQEVTNGE